MLTIDWIGIDWGTTRARAFGFDGAGAVVARSPEGPGMGALSPDGYEAALRAMVGDWLAEDTQLDVLICGMAGARQGWLEAPYREAPCLCAPSHEGVSPTLDDTRMRVTILPGICQHVPHADVMRGEETQILGFASHYPGFHGHLCLPGTHSKWVLLNDGRVERFQTHLTGELFDVLSQHSVLRHSVQADWSDDTFAQAVRDGYAAPAGLGASLFGIRASGLLNRLRAGSARARLSGLLIGSELASQPAQDNAVGLIGASALSDRYEQALAIVGISVKRLDGDEAVTAGLLATREAMRGGQP